MKKTVTFYLIIFVSSFSFGQTNERNFSKISQTYYLYQDKDLVEKTIDFINKSPIAYERLEMILTGFFGALFTSNIDIKKSFVSKFEKIEKNEIKELLINLSTSNIDTIYSKTKMSTKYNDMNWASFLATGNKKFVDNVISNIKHAEERIDVNLFLVGATAKWSLCSNSKQHKQVENYLRSLQSKNEKLKEILEQEPQYFRDNITEIIKEQRLKGLWNQK